MRQKICLSISWKIWKKNLMTKMNEKSYRILISLMFHHPKKKDRVRIQENPSRSARINKTYYFEQFLQRNLGEKGFLFYFPRNILKKVNEKAYLIFTLFYVHRWKMIDETSTKSIFDKVSHSLASWDLFKFSMKYPDRFFGTPIKINDSFVLVHICIK